VSDNKYENERKKEHLGMTLLMIFFLFLLGSVLFYAEVYEGDSGATSSYSSPYMPGKYWWP
jgi:hypothetical protein